MEINMLLKIKFVDSNPYKKHSLVGACCHISYVYEMLRVPPKRRFPSKLLG